MHLFIARRYASFTNTHLLFFLSNREWCRCEWQHLRERDRTWSDETLTTFTVRASLRNDLIHWNMDERVDLFQGRVGFVLV